MAASKVGLCNLALSHLGVSTTISSLTERTKEAIACATFYEQVRDEVLRDFPWSFATAIVDLALVTNPPNVEWQYAYQLPTDCVHFRRILNGTGRRDTRQTRVPYRLAGSLIFTNKENAQAEYTIRSDDPTRYPPDFAQSFSLLMAGYLAPRVTAGDQFKLGDRSLKLYEWRRATAQANDLSEEQADVPNEAEWIDAREGYVDPRFRDCQ